MFPHRRTRDRALRRGLRRRERAVARAHASPSSSPSAAAIRPTCSPTSCSANDCRPGVVAVGIANADVDGVARTLADPAVLISSSDAGAHMQMLCASGDTTLLLTRHVRERGDFTLERGRPRADRPPGRRVRLHRPRRRSPRATSPTSRCSRSTSCTTTTTSSSTTCPGRRAPAPPEGGYRATIVDGPPSRYDGERTGALPGRVISSIARPTRTSTGSSAAASFDEAPAVHLGRLAARDRVDDLDRSSAPCTRRGAPWRRR